MNPFQAKTVAAAIAPLLKVLKNLEVVAQASTDTINANEIEIVRLQAASFAADGQRLSANRIIEALGGIVNPKE